MFTGFSRRYFTKLAGLSALGMVATAAKSADNETKPAADRHAPASFPNDFIWGTATSAYQIEGAVNAWRTLLTLDPNDRRARIVHLTRAGRKLIACAFAEHSRTMEEAVGVLSSTERVTLVRLLKKLGKSLD